MLKELTHSLGDCENFLVQYNKFSPEQLSIHKLSNDEFSRSGPKVVNKMTKKLGQNDKKLGQNDNQISGTDLFQTRSDISLLPAVVKEILIKNGTVFSINVLECTLSFSKFKLGQKFRSKKSFYYVDPNENFHKTTPTTSNGALCSYQSFLARVLQNEL